jgi:hypothetical protein
MKKSYLILGVLILAIFLVGSVSATYCCEKTTQGAWCQDSNSESQCLSGNNPVTGDPYRKVQTSCEATSYCKPGTCINQQEGICMSNTPQIVCEGNYGFWSAESKNSLSQCQIGCCLIGDQAAFSTQVACNRMSALYGVKINWKSSINSELECLASANPLTEGACVYTADNMKTCAFQTKQDCQTRAKDSAYSDVEFHEGYLCSAQTLGTNCGKTSQTQCDDKSDVRFVDTCGNLGNIYDSSKIDNENYWTYIQKPTCGDSKGNKNSKSCGDCDYLSGSMCRQKETGETVTAGDNICKDLDCKGYVGEGFDGTSKYPKHGETWCATDSKTGDMNAPGATYFRLMCYNGEVTQQQCDSTRQEICAQKSDATSGFKSANCRKNYWEDCTMQNNSKDCEDTEARDCVWQNWNGYYFTTDKGLRNENPDMPKGTCVPAYQPGFMRDGTSDSIINCGLATSLCYVLMEKPKFMGGDWKCAANCSCLDSTWAPGLNGICTSLGDCGYKKNYIGTNGYKNDVITITKGQED